MASNPLEGIFLDNKYYQIESGSHRMTIPVANSAVNTQSSRTFSVTGTKPTTHTFTLTLNNVYEVRGISNISLGNTTNKGISQLAVVKSLANYLGNSLPLNFIDRSGTSYGVVITGALDISDFSDTLQPDGVEYRVNLTLESV